GVGSVELVTASAGAAGVGGESANDAHIGKLGTSENLWRFNYMTPRNCRRAIFILTLAVLLAPLCLAQTGREFHWGGKLAPEKIVEIKNINGTIDAQVTGGDQVEVTAEQIGPGADGVISEVVSYADGDQLCRLCPGGV